jgi:ubiquinone/menaquinone biosynthesis C-methylase UbiE
MPRKEFSKRLARAILIDRATSQNHSLIGRIARERSEENYRFAANFVADKTVLDIGGGTGIGHDLLLARGAASIVSLDCYVATNAHDNDPRLNSIQGDFLAYPLSDESFDVIICLGTLFYLRDGDAALLKMHRLLKPGGMLIVNCINQALIRRYFGMSLEEVDQKFSAAYDANSFRALLTKHFHAEPVLYVQQPVPVSGTLRNAFAFWLMPLTWPLRRHPVMPGPPGSEGMYNYAVIAKNRRHGC